MLLITEFSFHVKASLLGYNYFVLDWLFLYKQIGILCFLPPILLPKISWIAIFVFLE